MSIYFKVAHELAKEALAMQELLEDSAEIARLELARLKMLDEMQREINALLDEGENDANSTD